MSTDRELLRELRLMVPRELRHIMSDSCAELLARVDTALAASEHAAPQVDGSSPISGRGAGSSPATELDTKRGSDSLGPAGAAPPSVSPDDQGCSRCGSLLHYETECDTPYHASMPVSPQQMRVEFNSDEDGLVETSVSPQAPTAWQKARTEHFEDLALTGGEGQRGTAEGAEWVRVSTPLYRRLIDRMLKQRTSDLDLIRQLEALDPDFSAAPRPDAGEGLEDARKRWWYALSERGDPLHLTDNWRSFAAGWEAARALGREEKK